MNFIKEKTIKDNTKEFNFQIMSEEKVITEFGNTLKNAIANKTNDLNQCV